MEENQHPSNLMSVKAPKVNPEIESCHQFQNNTSFQYLYRTNFKGKSKHYTSTDQKKPFLDHGRKTGQNFSRQSTKQG